MKNWISCDTFLVRSVGFPELFRITLSSFLGGSSNVVDIAGYLGLFLVFSHSVYSLPGLF